MKNAIIIACLTLFNSAAMASGTIAELHSQTLSDVNSSANFTAETDELLIGEYKTPADSFYSDLEISEWAGDYIINGLANFGGTYLEFEGQLELTEGEYRGEGQLNVAYTNGLTCRYKMEFIVRARGPELYLKTRGPTQIYTTIPANWFACPAAPATGVSVIKKPFVLIEN